MELIEIIDEVGGIDEYIGGCFLIGVSLPLNIMWLIREIKEGEEDE